MMSALNSSAHLNTALSANSLELNKLIDKWLAKNTIAYDDLSITSKLLNAKRSRHLLVERVTIFVYLALNSEPCIDNRTSKLYHLAFVPDEPNEAGVPCVVYHCPQPKQHLTLDSELTTSTY